MKIGETMNWELLYSDIESKYTLHNIALDEYTTIGYMDDTHQVLDLMDIMEQHEISTQKIVEKDWIERRGEDAITYKGRGVR